MCVWNPWHGCRKISAGCQNCYVYRQDALYDKNSSIVSKNKSFDMPLKKARNGSYKIVKGSTVYTCLTSDFFLEEADKWRSEAWSIIKQRSDVNFLIITKRIHRFKSELPDDWQNGYENVAVACTAENQKYADYRLPIFMSLPIKHKFIVCEPLLGKIDISSYLTSQIEGVVAGGESGNEARVCDYSWILSLREQCFSKKVNFTFKQTGAFFKKDGKIYRILRKFQHSQARKAAINLGFKNDFSFSEIKEEECKNENKA